jgi:hypothetical protein
LLALASSQDSLRWKGLSISTSAQVFAATWAFLGIPLAINAGVGTLYRIEACLKIFFFYQAASLVLSLAIPVMFLMSGSLCDSMVDSEVQRMGSSFVCGFMDTFFFVWLLICGTIHAYLVYIVWSAGEEIASNPYPELQRYREALSKVNGPTPPGKHPLNPRRSMPAAVMKHAPLPASPRQYATSNKQMSVAAPIIAQGPSLVAPPVYLPTKQVVESQPQAVFTDTVGPPAVIRSTSQLNSVIRTESDNRSTPLLASRGASMEPVMSQVHVPPTLPVARATSSQSYGAVGAEVARTVLAPQRGTSAPLSPTNRL